MSRVIVILSAILAVSLVLGPAASANATKTTLTFRVNDAMFGVPERTWVSDGVFHFSGQPFTSLTPTVGDLTANVRGVTNGALRLETGHITIHGTIAFETNDISWEGSFRGQSKNGVGTGTFVLQGSDGSKMHGTFEQAAPFSSVFRYEVVVIDPHGGSVGSP